MPPRPGARTRSRRETSARFGRAATGRRECVRGRAGSGGRRPRRAFEGVRRVDAGKDGLHGQKGRRALGGSIEPRRGEAAVDPEQEWNGRGRLGRRRVPLAVRPRTGAVRRGRPGRFDRPGFRSREQAADLEDPERVEPVVRHAVPRRAGGMGASSLGRSREPDAGRHERQQRQDSVEPRLSRSRQHHGVGFAHPERVNETGPTHDWLAH